MKPFSAFLDEYGAELYPDIDGLGDDFRNAVAMWFLTREVCNDGNFVRFFRRVIIRDFGQYLQLLRIEPNIAEYDWLVQNYNEAMTEIAETASGTSGNTRTNNLADSNTRTNNLTDTESATDTTETESTKTRDLTDERTVSNSDTYGHKITTAGTTATEAGGTDTTETETDTDTKGLAKDNPMSITYATGIDIADGDALQWDYPSAQTEQATKTTDTRGTTYGRTDTATTSAETTHSGTDTKSGTDSTERTGTETTEGESTRTRTGTTTRTGTVADTATHSGTVTDAGTTSGSRTNVTKHINTGRNVDISTLLTNATSFIIGSSAFEWIRGRLEPCFMAVYDDDSFYEGV